MNSTTLSSDKAIAYLSPGATWGKAVGDLEPYNVTVVGGRIGTSYLASSVNIFPDLDSGDVGVGGLLVGCGLSFLSSQYGLPCDYGMASDMCFPKLRERVVDYFLVTNYEVVLANGTIVNANAQSNPDLFWALKGGGNQFGVFSKQHSSHVLIITGIVTKFTIKTIPLGLVSFAQYIDLVCRCSLTARSGADIDCILRTLRSPVRY